MPDSKVHQPFDNILIPKNQAHQSSQIAFEHWYVRLLVAIWQSTCLSLAIVFDSDGAQQSSTKILPDSQRDGRGQIAASLQFNLA
jgi:hypothetical protein